MSDIVKVSLEVRNKILKSFGIPKALQKDYNVYHDEKLGKIILSLKKKGGKESD